MPADFSTKTLAAVEVKDNLVFYPTDQAETPVAREDVVMNALAQQIAAAIDAAGLQLPERVVSGRFSASDYDRFKRDGTYGIAFWPLTERNANVFFPTWSVVSPPAVPLHVTLENFDASIVLNGSVNVGLMVMLVIGTVGNGTTASFTTTDDDTLETVAETISQKLIAAGAISEVVGTIATTDIPTSVRISAPVRRQREVQRIMQNMQISVWSGERELSRWIGDCMRNTLGTITNEFIPIGDGTFAWCKQVSHRLKDDDELDSLWVYHLIMSVEYPIMEIQTAYPILASRVSLKANHVPQETTYL
jgi:hypothetical protein